MPEQTPYESDQRRRHVNALCEAIFYAFPPEPYTGTILAGGDTFPGHDYPHEAQPEEDIVRSLKHQRWTHIPASFLERHLGDFVFLTAEAFTAFIPAWLLFALDNDNQGGEFIAYTFAPDEVHEASPNENPSQLQIRPLTVEMFRALTPPQRRVIRDFLIYLSEHHASDFIADRAAAAVDTVSNLITVFEPESE